MKLTIILIMVVFSLMVAFDVEIPAQIWDVLKHFNPSYYIFYVIEKYI